MLSDYELWDAWREGDSESGRTLFGRHFEAVYRFLFNKLGDDSVDDILQQSFLACLESDNRYEKRSSFRGYILGIAKNKLFKHIRSKTRQRIDGPPASQAYEFSIAEALADAREQQILLQALRRLPIELQTLVELSYWEDLTNQEVARVLDVPIGTLKSRLRKARTQLRSEIETLVASPELRRATLDDFETWIASARVLGQLSPQDHDPPSVDEGET